MTIVGHHTKVNTFSRPTKWLFLLVDMYDRSGNNHSLKLPFWPINKPQKM